MPKQKKSGEAFFDERYNDLQKALDKHLDAVRENTTNARKKKALLIKTYAEHIKHNQVRNIFQRLAKPADLEKIVNSIDEGTGGKTPNSQGKSRGETWEEAYTKNATEMCRLTDDALSVYKKFINKKEEEEKKILEIRKKAEDFHNSCLEKLKELKSEGQKPFQIGTDEGPRNDYLYSGTPFQCYQDSK